MNQQLQVSIYTSRLYSSLLSSSFSVQPNYYSIDPVCSDQNKDLTSSLLPRNFKERQVIILKIVLIYLLFSRRNKNLNCLKTSLTHKRTLATAILNYTEMRATGHYSIILRSLLIGCHVGKNISLVHNNFRAKCEKHHPLFSTLFDHVKS